MLSTLQSEDEEVESALIPFLQAYVSKLRNSQKRGGSISQVPDLPIHPHTTRAHPALSDHSPAHKLPAAQDAIVTSQPGATSQPTHVQTEAVGKA